MRSRSAARSDVVLMDVRMSVMDGLEATGRIAREALRAGASGFVAKDIELAELLQAVRVVAGGEALLSPFEMRRLIAEFSPAHRRRNARTAPGPPHPHWRP